MKWRVANHRSENLEAIQQYDRDRSKTPERKAYHRQNSKLMWEKYPERRSAHIAVGNAVRDGKLFKQPCFICGSTKVEAHHPDYSAPLDVVWLCKPHHEEVHK